MKKEVYSFLVIGVFNTIFTWIIYWGLLSFFAHQVSYAIVFVIGTLTSWFLNSRKTFEVDLSAKKLVVYFLFYLFSYLFGRTVLYFCVDVAGINEYIAIILVTAVSIPVNFAGSRWVLKGSIRPTSP